MDPNADTYTLNEEIDGKEEIDWEREGRRREDRSDGRKD